MLLDLYFWWPGLGSGVPLPQTAVVFDQLAVWLGGYDITGTLNENRFQVRREEIPDVPFGEDIRSIYPGRMLVDLSHSGFYDGNAGPGSVEAVIAAARVIGSNKASWPLTMCPPLAPAALPGADGNVCYSILGAQVGYRLGAQHGESLPYSLKTVPTHQTYGAGAVRQTILLPKATYGATTTGRIRFLGSVAAGHALVGVLHVFAVTGGTWTVTIESDDDLGFATPTVVQTFTGAAGITRQAIDTPGPITDSYYRAVLTKSGGTSCVAAVALGIS